MQIVLVPMCETCVFRASMCAQVCENQNRISTMDTKMSGTRSPLGARCVFFSDHGVHLINTTLTQINFAMQEPYFINL